VLLAPEHVPSWRSGLEQLRTVCRDALREQVFVVARRRRGEGADEANVLREAVTLAWGIDDGEYSNELFARYEALRRRGAVALDAEATEGTAGAR
jgi:hypothetical protein